MPCVRHFFNVHLCYTACVLFCNEQGNKFRIFVVLAMDDTDMDCIYARKHHKFDKILWEKKLKSSIFMNFIFWRTKISLTACRYANTFEPLELMLMAFVWNFWGCLYCVIILILRHNIWWTFWYAIGMDVENLIIGNLEIESESKWLTKRMNFYQDKGDYKTKN